jgi:hypothetical protein
VSAVELLQHHHAGELVGQRHRAERETQVAALEVESARAADDEAQVAPLLAALLQELAEGHRVAFAPVGCEQDHIRAVRDPAVHRLVLAHLDQLQPRVPGEQLLVVLNVVRVRRSEAPDG